MSKIKLATAWLDGCSGCHMSLLDIDEALATVAEQAEIVWGPLVDAQEFPDGVDVTLVEGAVSSQDDLKLIQTIRQRTRILVALGDCAVTSNVPAMRNSLPVKKLLESVYGDPSLPGAGIPQEGVPSLLRHAVPLHAVVKVDVHVPGCPPKAQTILAAVSALLAGRKPDLAAAQVKFG